MPEPATRGRVAPIDALLAEVRRSARKIAILGGVGVALGLLTWAIGAGRHTYIFGLVPIHWFLVAAGAIVPLIAYSQVSELRDLDFRLTADGVRSRDATIPWDEVAEVYHGGTIILAQGLIRSGENRRLRIVAKDGRTIELELRLFGRASKEVPGALAAITGEIVETIVDRQRRELDARLDAGERVRFGDALWIGADGVAKSPEDQRPIALASVTGITCDEGRLRLHYADAKGRPSSRAIGKFQETANVHLLEWALRDRDPR